MNSGIEMLSCSGPRNGAEDASGHSIDPRYSTYLRGSKCFEETDLDPENQQLFRKCLKKEPIFTRIWLGRSNLRLKKLLPLLAVDERGRIFYRGRLYDKHTWTKFFEVDVLLWGPPPYIRRQGRYAREPSDPFNDYPTEVKEKTDEYGNERKFRVRRVCDVCSGPLEYDRRAVLFCKNCFIENLL